MDADLVYLELFLNPNVNKKAVLHQKKKFFILARTPHQAHSPDSNSQGKTATLIQKKKQIFQMKIISYNY